METTYERPIEQSERRTVALSSFPMGMFGRRISWASIIAGVVATTFVQMLLSALGTGIGANVVDAANTTSKGMGIGAGTWFFASTLISLFVGGWISGRLSGIPRKVEGMMHGFLTASFGTMFFFFVLTTAIGGLFGTASKIIGGGLQGAASNSSVTQRIANIANANSDTTNPPDVASDQNQNAVSDENATDESLQTQTTQRVNQAKQAAAPAVAATGYGFFALLLCGCLAAMLGGYLSGHKELRQVSSVDFSR